MKEKLIPHWEYEQLNCCLVKYKLPLLNPCYILCHEDEFNTSNQPQLLCFAHKEAKRLSQQHTGSRENFMLALSGENIRRRTNWHIHIFIVQSRWQKAYVYHILGIKNLGLAIYNVIKY